METSKSASRVELLALFNAAPPQTLFNQKTLAAVRGCSEATLERDRWAGGGVPFIKLNRQVRYRKSDILTWLESHQLRTSTSQGEAA